MKSERPFKKKEKSGGFSYFLAKEQIRNYLRLTPRLRLEWLEEANRFIYLALSPKIRNQFRKGQV